MPFPRLGVAGLPWLVKAAQGGLAVAQYEIANDLLLGQGCRRDEDKALRWLRMAADQGQPNAEITLATRLLHGASGATNVAEAISRLKRAAGQGTEDGSQEARLLLAAILAATPQPTLRDRVHCSC
ncbi:MAG: tetratricopeptide repeat protein [Steroidobacteraceae bacterium]